MVAKPENYVATKSLPDAAFLSAFRRPNVPWPESLDGWPPKVLNAKAKKLLKRGLVSRVGPGFVVTIEGQRVLDNAETQCARAIAGLARVKSLREEPSVIDEARLGEFPRNTLPEEA